VNALNRRPWLFFGPAALAAGGIAATITLASRHEQQRGVAVALLLFVGWSFAGAGLVGWTRRPHNRTGMLMVAVGFGVFLGSLGESNYAFPYTLGAILGSLFIAVFVHLLLAYPTGRLLSRVGRIVVGAAYVTSLIAPLLDTMFPTRKTCKPHACPSNLVLLTRDHTAHAVVTGAWTAGAAIIFGAVVLLILGRWRTATPALRRTLRPVYVAGGLSVVLLAVGFVVQPFSQAGNAIVAAALIFTFSAVPFLFLAGLLRTSLARGAGLETIFREIPERASPDEVQNGLRRALADPTLEVAYWYPAGGHYVDDAGNRLELPRNTSRRVVTRLEYADTPIAALVHDAGLLQQPELLSTVAGAARVALERDRLLVEDRARAERYRALLDAMPDLMFRISSDGTYTGYSAQDDSDLVVRDVVGLTVWDRLPEALAGRVMAAGHRALVDRRTETLEYELDFDGELRHFEGRIAAAGEHEFLLIVRNITERKLQERELQASRARIVAAGDEARRRLERNLHDGAQQRLVSLSVSLALAQKQVRTDPEAAHELIERSREELSQALEELRELARGIHPAVLTDRGLNAAIDALAARAPLPVEIDVPADPLPPPVEAAAYYVVSEALANVAKYAAASHVRVSVAADDGAAVVEVADDGLGGADPLNGSGLRGLADRVAALEGTLHVASPAGEGTTIRVEIPLGVR
jgi:signal transduction histidine kinase